MHALAETPAVISVTVLAEPSLPDDRVILRSGARDGDLIAVTGELGGSLDTDGGGRHLDFPPRITEAISLAQELGEDLVAMIDVSDGVARDAMRLIEASSEQIRCVLFPASIPARAGLDWKRALGDGEDYELLFCCRRDPPKEIEGLPITVIGRIQAAAQGDACVVAVAEDGGALVDLAELGWEHAPER
jgi:thiamine-monophosphate kinase